MKRLLAYPLARNVRLDEPMFRNLLSDGGRLIALTPAESSGAWRLAARARAPFMSHWAMFGIIRPTRVRP
jgi:hypothetical protein